MAVLNRQRWWRRALPLTAVLACAAAACTPDVPPAAPAPTPGDSPVDTPEVLAALPTSAPGADPTDDLAFELVSFVPWMRGKFGQQVIYFSMLAPDGSSKFGGRAIPDLLLGPDGSVWLLATWRSKIRAVRCTGAGPCELVVLGAARAGTVESLAPAPDGGAVLFGRRASGESVLARLSDAGKVVWRKTDLPPAQEGHARARLVADLDGALYLYTADRPAGEGGAGEVVRVGLDDGALSGVTAFENAPREIGVREGSLYWVAYADGVYSWVRHEIATGERRAVEASAALQSAIKYGGAAAPGGGALLGVPRAGSLLIWMGADGKEIGRLTLGGIVRAGDGLATAVQEGDRLALARWEEGQEAGRVEIDVSSRRLYLIHADGEDYYLTDKTQILAVDADGEEREAVPVYEVNGFLKAHKAGVAVTSAILAPDGSVLLAGSDPEGAYAVRITGAP